MGKQHKTWILDEVRHWHEGPELIAAVWKADFRQLLELWSHLGWDMSTEIFASVLDACRLVVNVHKHGGGTSLEDLKQRFPEYLVDPLRDSGGRGVWSTDLNHTHLRLAEKHLEAFSNAIVAFWRRVPYEVWNHQVTIVPDWFGKALEKDRKTNALDRL